MSQAPLRRARGYKAIADPGRPRRSEAPHTHLACAHLHPPTRAPPTHTPTPTPPPAHTQQFMVLTGGTEDLSKAVGGVSALTCKQRQPPQVPQRATRDTRAVVHSPRHDAQGQGRATRPQNQVCRSRDWRGLPEGIALNARGGGGGVKRTGQTDGCSKEMAPRGTGMDLQGPRECNPLGGKVIALKAIWYVHPGILVTLNWFDRLFLHMSNSCEFICRSKGITVQLRSVRRQPPWGALKREGASKARCGPTTKLQPRLPHGLPCLLSSICVRVTGTVPSSFAPSPP